MQASKLIENISSESIAEENVFLPKAAPRRVLVYVESDEDISFWRNILHEYETRDIEFDIQTPTHKGKQKAIEKSHELLHLKTGQFLIVCVDSDYDYLLPEHSPSSKEVNENPYIFQTYSYSIENLQCFSDSLHIVCVQSTKHDKRIINFNELLSAFSEIIYPLFLWNLYFRKNNDHTAFTISDFCEIIKLTDKIDVTTQCAHAINGLKKRVDARLTSLENDYPLALDDIRNIASSLGPMGVNLENIYLFIQGHTLKDNVVLMVLKSVCDALIKEKEATITQQYAGNKQHLVNEMNHYRNQKQPVSSVLNSNTEYKNCFLFRKIKTDLDGYVATLTHHA